MKNKYVILIIGFVVLFCATIGFLMFKEESLYTITLDINPSIELKVNKDNKVKRVKALNDDGKDIISDDIKNISLDDALEKITEKVIEKGYILDNEVVIVISSTGNYDNDKVKDKLEKSFIEKNIHPEVIVIEHITNDDIKLANQYDITPAKAAYINSILDKNDKVEVESLVDKSVRELKETKETGKYCDPGYYLEGDFCIKKEEILAASKGEVCPVEYYDYNGKCYKDVGSVEIDELECNGDNQILDGDMCLFKEHIDAKPNFKCEVGELIRRDFIGVPEIRENGDPNEYLCEDQSNASYPTERCYLQEHAIINGMCAMGPKPLLPTATGCEGHDINYNGGCYDPYPDEPYVCPNGERFDTNTEPCKDTFTYTKASGEYTCPDGYTLSGHECLKDREEKAHKKRVCLGEYTMVETGRCLDLNDQVDFISGYKCDRDDARVEGDKCVVITVVDAKN